MISLFVADVLGAVANISQQYYNDLGDGLAAVLYSVATIIFIVLVVNYLFQIKQFTFGAYVGWMIRITIIITAATSWAAYEPIYNAARAIPDNIAATLLGGEDVFTALDAMIDKGFEVAANSFEQGDWSRPGTLFHRYRNLACDWHSCCVGHVYRSNSACWSCAFSWSRPDFHLGPFAGIHFAALRVLDQVRDWFHGHIDRNGRSHWNYHGHI